MSYFPCLIPTPYGISPLRSNRFKQCSHFVVLSACFYVYVGNQFAYKYFQPFMIMFCSIVVSYSK